MAGASCNGRNPGEGGNPLEERASAGLGGAIRAIPGGVVPNANGPRGAEETLRSYPFAKQGEVMMPLGPEDQFGLRRHDDIEIWAAADLAARNTRRRKRKGEAVEYDLAVLLR